MFCKNAILIKPELAISETTGLDRGLAGGVSTAWSKRQSNLVRQTNCSASVEGTIAPPWKVKVREILIISL